MEITLLELFEKNEKQFRNELSRIKLPKDLEVLKKFMNSFFTNKLALDEYKKELSMSEAAMLNSTLKLITNYTAILNDYSTLSRKEIQVIQTQNNKNPGAFFEDINLSTVGFTAVGGVIGGWLFKTWGGVLLSVAGCVLGMYLKSNNNESKKGVDEELGIDVDTYVAILKKMCSDIDEIMSNYKVGVLNSVKPYINAPKATLMSAYKPLLVRLATLHASINNDILPNDTKEEFEKLYRTLQNHHYEFIPYSEATRQYYTETPSTSITKPYVIQSTVLEKGEVVISGECLIPEN